MLTRSPLLRQGVTSLKVQAAIAGGGYVALLTVLYVAQERLIFPGDAAWDAIAPRYRGKPIERLRALARSPVELLVVEGAGHNDIQRFPGYVEPLAERLLRLGGR